MSQTALKISDDFIADGHTALMAQSLAIKARNPGRLVCYLSPREAPELFCQIMGTL